MTDPKIGPNYNGNLLLLEEQCATTFFSSSLTLLSHYSILSLTYHDIHLQSITLVVAVYRLKHFKFHMLHFRLAFFIKMICHPLRFYA